MSIDLEGALDEFADLLKAAGVPSASLDPHEVNTPGVWLQVTRIIDPVLGGESYTLELTAIAVAADKGVRRSTRELSKLLEQISGVCLPSGDVTVVTVTFPEAEALPGLSIPLTVTVS